MIPPSLNLGDQYEVQFVWQLPTGDYLRTVFSAEVLKIEEAQMRYIALLRAWVAGRQETPEGIPRPVEEWDRALWQTVLSFVGHKVKLSYESATGRPLYLRYDTLTGEHDFFYRTFSD